MQLRSTNASGDKGKFEAAAKIISSKAPERACNTFHDRSFICRGSSKGFLQVKGPLYLAPIQKCRGNGKYSKGRKGNPGRNSKQS